MSLMELYPVYWAGSPEFVALQEAFGPQVAALQQAVEAARDQMVLSSATWGLRYWEQALGLPVDEGRDPVFRRERIAAKLRGASVTTEEMIRNVAQSFSGGQVEVTVQPEIYTVLIHFVGTIGIPDNVPDLSRTLTEILPAHLAWSFRFNYNPWGVTKAHTWGECRQRTWKELKEKQWTS